MTFTDHMSISPAQLVLIVTHYYRRASPHSRLKIGFPCAIAHSVVNLRRKLYTRVNRYVISPPLATGSRVGGSRNSEHLHTSCACHPPAVLFGIRTASTGGARYVLARDPSLDSILRVVALRSAARGPSARRMRKAP